MAIVYHRDDPGAPQLTYSSLAPAGFAAFKQVLVACLVSGYAGKPAAGWELIYEGDSTLVLRNGSRSGYVCFTFSSSMLLVYLAETYTGVPVGANVMSGAGLKSGTDTGNTVPHRILVQHFARASASSTWAVVADERTFILLGTTVNSLNPEAFTAISAGALSTQIYVGEDTQGNFIAVGGLNHTSTTSTPYSYFEGDRGATVLKDPDTGLLVDTGSITIMIPGTVNPTIDATAQPMAVPEISLSKLGWAKSGSPLAGYFRGMAWDLMFTRMSVANVALSLGASEILTTRTANTSLDLGDGHSYFLTVTSHAVQRFVTDNPEFW